MSILPTRLPLSLLAALLICAVDAQAFGAGELDELRREVRKERDLEGKDVEAQPAAIARPSYFDEDGEEDKEPSLFAQMIGRDVVFVTTMPFWVPQKVLGDDQIGEATFLDFPYQEGRPGRLLIDEYGEEAGDPWTVRLATDYGTNFDSLSRLGVRGVLDTTWRVGVEGSWQQWYEDSGGTTDELVLAELNLIHRFAQSEQTQFFVGAGVNWLDDPAGTDLGLNLTYGFDWQPQRPYVISASIDGGTIGSARLFRFRSTVGVVLRRWETYIGYERQVVGDAELNALVAGGQITF